MIKERKCTVCGKWTDGSKTHCEHCGALTDPALVAERNKEERDADRQASKLKNESKTARKLRALKKSDKVFHRIIFYIADTIFTIYMAILSFIVWLIAFITG